MAPEIPLKIGNCKNHLAASFAFSFSPLTSSKHLLKISIVHVMTKQMNMQDDHFEKK